MHRQGRPLERLKYHDESGAQKLFTDVLDTFGPSFVNGDSEPCQSHEDRPPDWKAKLWLKRGRACSNKPQGFLMHLRNVHCTLNQEGPTLPSISPALTY